MEVSSGSESEAVFGGSGLSEYETVQESPSYLNLSQLIDQIQQNQNDSNLYSIRDFARLHSLLNDVTSVLVQSIPKENVGLSRALALICNGFNLLSENARDKMEDQAEIEENFVKSMKEKLSERMEVGDVTSIDEIADAVVQKFDSLSHDWRNSSLQNMAIENNKELRDELTKATNQLMETRQKLYEANSELEENKKLDGKATSQLIDTQRKLEEANRELSLLRAKSPMDTQKVTYLKRALKDSENQIAQLVETNKQLKMTCEIQRQDYEHKIELLEQTPFESSVSFDSFVQSFDEISAQLAHQTDELSQGYTERDNLISMIQRLLSLCQKYEEALSKKQTEVSFSATNEPRIEPSLKIEVVNPYGELQDFVALLPDSYQQEAHEVIKDIKDPQEILKTLIDIIMARSNTSEIAEENARLKRQNSLLATELNGQLNFLESLANGRCGHSWISEESDANYSNGRLLSQCARTSAFLRQNAVGLISDHPVFTELLDGNDFLQVDTKLHEFLQTCPHPTTEEGQQIFLYLVETIAANDVIRKFATEAQNQYISLGKKADNLQNDLSAITLRNNENEKQLSFVKEQITEYEEQNKKLMGVIREFKLDTLDHFDVNSEESDYTRSLEDKLSLVVKDAAASRSECMNKIEELTQQLDSMTSELQALQRDHHSTKQQFITEQEKCELIQGELENTKALYQTALSEKQELEELILSLNNEIVEIHDETVQVAQESSEAFENLKKAAKSKVRKLKKALKETQSQLVQVNNTCQSQIENLKELLSTTQRSEASALQKLRETTKDFNSKLATLQVENRLLKSRLIAKDEKLRHDQAISESQMKVKLIALQTEAQSQIDSYRTTYDEEVRSLLTAVCLHFKEFIDLREPLTLKSVEKIILQARAKLDDITRDMQNILVDNQTAKQIIKAPADVRLTQSLADFVKESRTMTMKLHQTIKALNKKISGMTDEVTNDKVAKEWEDWCKNLLYIAGAINFIPKSASEMRYGLEEVVFSSMGNRLMWRRLEQLRLEKSVLASGIQIPLRSETQTFGSLIIALSCLRRIQKESGCLTTPFSLSHRSCHPAKIQPTKKLQRQPVYGLISLSENHNSN